MSVWCTQAEAIGITHDDRITQDDVDFAEETTMLYSGRTTADVLRLRDLFWLKRVVAWQTTWQMDQPGYTERSMAKEIIQDGTQITYAGSNDVVNPATFMLAPNAYRALKNCSWMKSRSARFRPARPPRSNFDWPNTPFPSDYKSNDDHPWEPM